MRYVRIHGPEEKHLVLIIHGHDNKQFGMASSEVLTKGISGCHEVVGVTGRGCVTELCKLLVSLSCGYDGRWDIDVKDEIAADELDLFDRTTLHELLPGDGPACTTGSMIHARALRRGRVLLGLGVLWGTLVWDAGHRRLLLVTWLQMGLGARVRRLVRLC